MKVYTMKNNGHMYVEELPTNTVSGPIAGLPPDDPPMKKRKKKFKTDMFSRIRNSKLKEETMEETTLINEMESGNTETASAMRFIQQKRKVAKKQEREKRAQLRKQEIQALSKAKAKDYQNKASERQKKVAKDINKASTDTMKNSFDFAASFAELNPEFVELPENIQNKIIDLFIELSEDNQDKMANIICEENGIDTIQKFVETL
jgi:hypothetical protein